MDLSGMLDMMDTSLNAGPRSAPDAPPPEVVAARIQIAQAARAAKQWFEAFYSSQRDEYLKVLVQCSTPAEAYEISCQVRVLEAMHRQFERDCKADAVAVSMMANRLTMEQILREEQP